MTKKRFNKLTQQMWDAGTDEAKMTAVWNTMTPDERAYFDERTTAFIQDQIAHGDLRGQHLLDG